MKIILLISEGNCAGQLQFEKHGVEFRKSGTSNEKKQKIYKNERRYHNVGTPRETTEKRNNRIEIYRTQAVATIRFEIVSEDEIEK